MICLYENSFPLSCKNIHKENVLEPFLEQQFLYTTCTLTLKYIFQVGYICGDMSQLQLVRAYTMVSSAQHCVIRHFE